MKRKNKIKSMVDCCFICGKNLPNLEDKVGCRINPKKGNSKCNLLIVCEDCKKNILKKYKIYEIFSKNYVLDRYFANFSQEDRKIILNKLKIMQRKED